MPKHLPSTRPATRVQNATEATFRFKNLDDNSAEAIVAQLRSVTALDLSNNSISDFPYGMASSLIALDLSFNAFHCIASSKRLGNLLELKLRGNCIEKMGAIYEAVALRFLDLSENKISRVEGLEPLAKLEVLLLESNIISSTLSIRALSFNKKLTTLDLSGNPICEKNCKQEILNLIPSLVQLNKHNVIQRSGVSAIAAPLGYATIFDHRKVARQGSDESGINDEKDSTFRRGSSSQNSPGNTAAATATTSKRVDSKFLESGISSTSEGSQRTKRRSSSTQGAAVGAGDDLSRSARLHYNGTEEAGRSILPWRNPPSLQPRQLQRNQSKSSDGKKLNSDSNGVTVSGVLSPSRREIRSNHKVDSQNPSFRENSSARMQVHSNHLVIFGDNREEFSPEHLPKPQPWMTPHLRERRESSASLGDPTMCLGMPFHPHSPTMTASLRNGTLSVGSSVDVSDRMLNEPPPLPFEQAKEVCVSPRRNSSRDASYLVAHSPKSSTRSKPPASPAFSSNHNAEVGANSNYTSWAKAKQKIGSTNTHRKALTGEADKRTQRPQSDLEYEIEVLTLSGPQQAFVLPHERLHHQSGHSPNMEFGNGGSPSSPPDRAYDSEQRQLRQERLHRMMAETYSMSTKPVLSASPSQRRVRPSSAAASPDRRKTSRNSHENKVSQATSITARSGISGAVHIQPFEQSGDMTPPPPPPPMSPPVPNSDMVDGSENISVVESIVIDSNRVASALSQLMARKKETLRLLSASKGDKS